MSFTKKMVKTDDLAAWLPGLPGPTRHRTLVALPWAIRPTGEVAEAVWAVWPPDFGFFFGGGGDEDKCQVVCCGVLKAHE